MHPDGPACNAREVNCANEVSPAAVAPPLEQGSHSRNPFSRKRGGSRSSPRTGKSRSTPWSPLKSRRDKSNNACPVTPATAVCKMMRASASMEWPYWAARTCNNSIRPGSMSWIVRLATGASKFLLRNTYYIAISWNGFRNVRPSRRLTGGTVASYAASDCISGTFAMPLDRIMPPPGSMAT